MSCDDCDEPLRKSSTGKEIWHDHDDFDILVADAKEEGWALTKNKGKWEHICFDCV